MRGLLEFLDSRLGLSELLRKLGTEKLLPAGTSWAHTLGFAALMVFVLMFVTGVGLSFHYSPSVDTAFDSLRVLERDIPWGRFLRGLHHWGASAMVLLVGVHAFRVFFMGAYKKPRELTWIVGLGLLATVLGLGFTGYLLPWDQKAFFATRAGVNLGSHAPLVGPSVKAFLYGGPDLGPTTLNRFHTLHVLVLPAALAALLLLHLHLVQRHGISPPKTPVGRPGRTGLPYHPYHSLKEGLVVLLVLSALALLALLLGAPLEAQAEPSETSYDPRPDWYFLAVFQLLKLFEGDLETLGAFWIPAAFGFLLLALPFLDRNPEQGLGKRPLALGSGAFVALALLLLTLLAALDPPRHPRIPAHPLGVGGEIRRGYDLVRRQGCFTCHTLTLSEGRVFGKSEYEEAPDMMDFEMDPGEMAEFLLDPESEIMPSFERLSEAERRAIGAYLESLRGR